MPLALETDSRRSRRFRTAVAIVVLGGFAVERPIAGADPPDGVPTTIVVDRDDIRITNDCVLVPGPLPVEDVDGDGVVHIVEAGVTVRIDGALWGVDPDSAPDTRRGLGIVITADDVTLRGGGVHGFRVGIEVRGADRTTIESIDASHQFAQRLRSTPEREDSSDWLWPHENDAGEWSARYGASIRVIDAERPVLRRIKVRGSQNGIMLERVRRGLVVDCDCSFLSGWGLSMWRTERSTIARNAFDFCVRGYSHGVYNRGQDSAGILIFEQCTFNRVLENSCTHGGDGVFGFGGRQALGQVPPPSGADDDWHRERGNGGNLFVGNDLSHAVAHGFEMTFSTGWILDRNRLHDNGICGVWGGYSSRAVMNRNDISDNGEMAYGREGGGIDIEHGVGNVIRGNRFVRNSEGVELWWDDDAALLQTPWALVNDTRSADTVISDNVFVDCGTAIDLRRTENTSIERNEFRGDGVGIAIEASPGTQVAGNRFDCPTPVAGGDRLANGPPVSPVIQDLPPVETPGDTRPVGARRHLAGRDRIVMTEWGPYDWATPLLRLESTDTSRHVWRLLGPRSVAEVVIEDCPTATAARGEELDRIVVTLPNREDDLAVMPYRLRVTPEGGEPLVVDGRFLRSTWRIATFATSGDPREDADRWATDRASPALRWTEGRLDLVYAMGGPTDIAPPDAEVDVARPAPGHERFGTVASTQLRLPAGRYRLDLLSDDGIRVRLGGRVVLDNWTWHPPTEDRVEFELDAPGEVDLEIEHFELDGYAVLRAEIVPLD